MKNLFLVAFLLADLAIVGCAAAQPDPDNGVSNASYRQVIVQAETNVAHAAALMREVRADEVANVSTRTPTRPTSWWNAEVLELEQADKLLVDTLKGATK